MKKYRFGKIYLEITNVCNLCCPFCHGTTRDPMFITPERFSLYLSQIRDLTPLIYLHVMGEPLLHPQLETLLRVAHENGVSVNITTNGTLLAEKTPILLNAPALQRVNISLHAAQVHDSMDEAAYIKECIAFTQQPHAPICCLRLWNKGAEDAQNDTAHRLLHAAFPGPWQETRKGFRLSDGVYLEYAARFDWPDPDADEDPETHVFCYGLRDQIAVLVDGTVVPCCLDADGHIPLGNLNTTPIADILSSPRAVSLYNGFTDHTAVEALCRHCKNAQRFR